MYCLFTNGNSADGLRAIPAMFLAVVLAAGAFFTVVTGAAATNFPGFESWAWWT